MAAANSTRFRQVLVVRNPVSTHAAQSKQRIAELQRFFGAERVMVIETVQGGAVPNRAVLRKYAGRLGPYTLLCIAAGDGTVGMVIEMLVQDPDLPEKARLTPVLPLWGGNANDLAHMLNGNATHGRLNTVLTAGQVITVHPLACMLTGPDGTAARRIAACYASFGATAFAAARLNEPGLRKHPLYHLIGGRFVTEFIAGFAALAKAPRFTLNEQGKKKIVYERTFTKGSRFAKVERLPLKLTEDAFLLHTLEEKRLLSVVPRMLEAMQKRLAARFRNDHSEFTVEQDILAQFDGEPTDIIAGTTVDISLSAQPFYALSVQLKDNSGTKP